MNNTDFKAAKGKKVYFVQPYNFNGVDWHPIDGTNERRVNVIELTVTRCGNITCYLMDYTGPCGTSLWFGRDGERSFNDCFTNLDNAVEYAKITWGHPAMSIYKRHAKLADWCAWCQDEPIKLY